MTKQLKTSLLFTILSLTASAFNFLFYPVISHLLSETAFGDIQIGVSFIMVAAALFTSLNTLALFLSAQKGGSEKSSLQHVEHLATTISLVLAILVIVFATPLQTLLNLQDASLLYILAVIFVINIPASTWVGVLQGNGQFVASGWVGLIAAITKIAFAALFIGFGWGAHGALIGMLLGFLVILPLVKLLQNKPLVSLQNSLRIINKRDFAYFKTTKTPLYILIGMICAAVIVNLDVTFAKIFFDPATAGSYAQISTAAKIPYFGLVPLTIIFFRRFIDTPYQIGKLTAFFIVAAVVVASLTLVLKDIIIGFVFGHSDTFGVFLPLIIAFTCYTLLVLFLYALVARKKIAHIVGLSIVSLTVTLAMLASNHATAQEIAWSFAISIFISTLLFATFLARQRI